MGSLNGIFAKMIDRRTAAKILGLKNSNHIAVWVGRNFLVPAQVDPVWGTKRQFKFNFTNLVEMAILKELNDSFAVEYSLGSLILNEAFGPGRDRLAAIIREGEGNIIIGKSYWISNEIPKSKIDITAKEYKLLKRNEGMEVKFSLNRLDISKFAENSDYLVIINLKKVIERLLNKI